MPTALYVGRQQFKSITPKVGRPKNFSCGREKILKRMKINSHAGENPSGRRRNSTTR